MDDTLKFLSMVLPIVPDAYYVLWWETFRKRPDGKRYYYDSEAFRTLEAMAEAHPLRANSILVRSLYFCISPQHQAARRPNRPGLVAIRNLANTVALKSLFFDLDVGKPGGYPTVADALQALHAFCDAIGMLYPTVVVYTSAPMDGSEPVTSGLHVYWVFDRVLTPEEWHPIARLLSGALQHAGMKFDLVVPTNRCWIGRAPGSINRKQDAPRIARIGAGTGETYNVDRIRAILAAAQGPQRERSHDHGYDHGVLTDLAEVRDVVEFLIPRGYFNRGNYDAARNLRFGLCKVIAANPKLGDAALAILERVVVVTGRDLDKNRAWLEQAIARAPEWAGENAVTLATTFAAALRLGWQPAITAAQRAAIEEGRGIVRGIFNSADLSREQMATRAAILIDRATDPLVRRRYGDFVGAQLARWNWPDSVIVNALRLARRVEIDCVPDWISRLRRPA
jgi:hypothetical protein